MVVAASHIRVVVCTECIYYSALSVYYSMHYHGLTVTMQPSIAQAMHTVERAKLGLANGPGVCLSPSDIIDVYTPRENEWIEQTHHLTRYNAHFVVCCPD